ncbi:MAG TPA: DsbA family oxidoreductase [Chryseosolibacter sp.]|nr:DsbA family oxidoreductase [Chryseosolibacter sp.]
MEQVRIKIGVVSDVVCPWCYIGKRRLEKAMRQLSDRFVFEVEYFPFELNPHMPEEGTDYKQYLCRKFGSESKFLELSEHVNQVAAREGLDFRLDLQSTVPNTRNAHRIIMLAREDGKQMEAVEGFFKAYFTEGVDLSKIESLIAISADAGLDIEKVDMLLHSNTGKLEIEMAEKELQGLGITSVPLFIIDDRFGISGAQSVETFTDAFEQAAMAHAGSKFEA